MRKIVTSYIKPDMDGIASMYEYSEYMCYYENYK